MDLMTLRKKECCSATRHFWVSWLLSHPKQDKTSKKCGNSSIGCGPQTSLQKIGYITRHLYNELQKSAHEMKEELMLCQSELNDVDSKEMEDDSNEWMDAVIEVPATHKQYTLHGHSQCRDGTMTTLSPRHVFILCYLHVITLL